MNDSKEEEILENVNNYSSTDPCQFDNNSDFNQTSRFNSKFICPYGCGKLLQMDSIASHRNECEFVEVLYDDDEILNSKDDKSQKQFDFSNGICKFCNTEVNYPNTKHIRVTVFNPSECKSFFGNCPNCLLINVNINEHFKICLLKPKKCCLEKIGCFGWIIHRSNTICSRFDNHQLLVEKMINEITDEIFKINLLNIGGDLKNIKTKVSRLNCEIAECKEIIKKNRENYYINRKGILVWKIDNARDFLNSNQSRCSPSVYTDDYGYKLCMKAYPKGDGIGKNSHFSLYFIILKGDYDNLLTWPFNRKIRITLYNSDVKCSSKCEIYKADERLKPYRQPDNEANPAMGNPKFIDLLKLEKGYIIENSLYIELYVEKEK